MKKAVLFLAAVAFLFAGNAQAQLGINIGYAPQTTTSVSGNSTSTSSMPGFFAGVNYNKELSTGLALSFGVQARYNTKTETSSLLSVTTTTKNTQFLIDVPVLLNFGFNLGSEARLAIFAGPTFSYALSGNTNIKENVLNSSNDYPWYGDNSKNKQFDILGTVGVSLDYKTVRLFGGYRLGFLDLNASDNIKSTTSGIFAGIGYLL